MRPGNVDRRTRCDFFCCSFHRALHLTSSLEAAEEVQNHARRAAYSRTAHTYISHYSSHTDPTQWLTGWACLLACLLPTLPCRSFCFLLASSLHTTGLASRRITREARGISRRFESFRPRLRFGAGDLNKPKKKQKKIQRPHDEQRSIASLSQSFIRAGMSALRMLFLLRGPPHNQAELTIITASSAPPTPLSPPRNTFVAFPPVACSQRTAVLSSAPPHSR